MAIIKGVSKDIEKFTAPDFVKMFLRMYKQEYGEGYSVNFPRDCSLMKKVMNKLQKHGKGNQEMLKFLRWAWKRKKQYICYKHQVMKIGFLNRVINDYIKIQGYKEIDLSLSNNKKEELDEEMKEWLRKERRK